VKTSVLLIGNFLSSSGGSRGVCEELALRLADDGAPVTSTSRQRNRVLRMLDMIHTVISQRRKYSVAQVDVFSGAAFRWAEMACATLRWLNKSYILTLHGGNLPEFAQRNPARVRRLLSSSKIVTAPSHFLLEKMSPYRSDLVLVLNALDIGRCPLRLRDHAKPSLVWLRAFHEIYNPSLAPKVLKLLIEKFPDAQLTMVGSDKKDGSWQRTIRIATELGVMDRICWQNGVKKKDVPSWLNRGDIFLNTTNVDNAPVSVIEAMACGLCVVSTNVGGLPYLLKDEHDALLVPAGDSARMAQSVELLLNDQNLTQKLSQNGRAKAELHDWSVVLPQWETLFRSLAKEPK
jgi:glycosyltransferase involved in cell wall biosynthesis